MFKRYLEAIHIMRKANLEALKIIESPELFVAEQKLFKALKSPPKEGIDD